MGEHDQACKLMPHIKQGSTRFRRAQENQETNTMLAASLKCLNDTCMPLEEEG